MKRIILPLVGLLFGGLLATPSAMADTRPDDTQSVQSIDWGACTDPQLVAAGAQCGTLVVPMDHAEPEGAKVTLAVSRVQHTTAKRKGVVLFAPNFLNGDGYRLSLVGSRLPRNEGAAYDWVGFAQRGLAPSAPAITCMTNWFEYGRPNYIPTTDALESAWLSRAKSAADECATSQPELQKYMKATDTAADMDSIRAALGVKKINVYAQSYGTYNAQVYATQYADRIRRMVLDSNINPSRVWYHASGLDQDAQLQSNVYTWFDWLARNDDVYHLGATRDQVQQTWDEQVRRVTEAPLGGKFGFNEWSDTFLYTAYSQQTWKPLAQAFADWVHHGDYSAMSTFFEQFVAAGFNHSAAVAAAQACTDASWPSDWDTWRDDTWKAHADAPDVAWAWTWVNSPCLYWHAKAGQPVDVHSKASALLVDETLDGATPFEGDLEVRSRFPNSALLAVSGGTNHANTLNGNACVDDTIAHYLATGELPDRKPGRQADTTCAPLPEPTAS